jgi:hypothetical protein
MRARPFAATSAVAAPIQALGPIPTWAPPALFAVFGSGVELETRAVLIIQPSPLPMTEVVIVNVALPLGASKPSPQRTVRIELTYVQPGADTNDARDGRVSVTATF